MAGRKVFQAATVLTAADVNEYLMDQSVMSFAGTAARASAIGTATEGMVTYLQDSNSLEFWNGAQWQNVNDNTASVPLNTVTAAGDLIVANGSASVTNLALGTANTLLYSNGSALSYLSAGTPAQILSIGTAGAIGWSDPAGGGGLTLLASGSLSGNTAITSISQDYKSLVLYVRSAFRTSSNFGMNFKSSTVAQEFHFWKDEYNGSSWSKDQSANQTSIFFSEFNSVDPGNGVFILELFNYASANQKIATYQAFPQLANLRIGYGGLGFDGSAGAIDEITIFVTSGNYELYGAK